MRVFVVLTRKPYAHFTPVFVEITEAVTNNVTNTHPLAPWLLSMRACCLSDSARKEATCFAGPFA